MKNFTKNIAVLAMLAISALFYQTVFANTAANTTITNTVTVRYQDAALTQQPDEVVSVSFTVNLRPLAPLVSTSSPAGPIDPATENTGYVLAYTVTSQANGEDTYNFTLGDTPTDMVASATGDDPSVLLGATSLAADAVGGAFSVTVPFDGTNNGSINGIVAGETVVINGDAYTVGAINEGTVVNNTVQLPVTVGIITAGGLGTAVGEQRVVNVTVTTDEINGVLTSGTHSVVSTATSVADGLQFTASPATSIVVRRPVLAVTKLVRNDTVPVLGTGATANVGGNDFYEFDVNGKPTDVMEYLIIVDNSTAGASTATNIIVQDPIPQFTTFVPGSVQLDPDGSGLVPLDETVDSGDAAELDGGLKGTIRVYAGAGGDDSPVGAAVGNGGTLLINETSHVLFQVVID
jgi:uncharacterized repeat protein (TIGR01451 family)